MRSIIFLCTANAIRSQIAEGYINAKTSVLKAYSAGVYPCGYVDKEAIAVMREIGIDLSSHYSKSVEEFKAKHIDIVITVSGTAYQECPEWLYQQAINAHWGFKDTSGESRRHYRRLRDEIKTHLDKFLARYDPAHTDAEVRALLRELSFGVSSWEIISDSKKVLPIVINATKSIPKMASEHSFDVVSKINLQELDNALNQARKELQQRYDLKDTKSAILFNEKDMELTLESASEFTLKSVIDILQSKLIKRGISTKVLDFQKIEPASQNTVRQKVKLKQGIDKETSKKITTAIKAMKLKVQAQVQGDEVRVSGKQIDDLQAVQKHLLSLDLGVPLQFVNYR